MTITISPDLALRTADMLRLFGTTGGHLCQRVREEHMGRCSATRGCTEPCLDWADLLETWVSTLERAAVETQCEQPGLFEAAG